jgi:imidazolonepropionase-like amidohydrolase
VAALALALVTTLHWVPLAWRSGDAGIESLANRLAQAGVSVQTTMVVYDTFIEMNGPGAARILAEPALDLLSVELRDRWRAMGANWPIPSMATTFLIPRYVEFLQQLTLALHRQGVLLMAGTDTMGVPLILPGTSLHRELQLLVESGLRPYEAIGTATVVPAMFLGRDREFGTVSVGKRADLLLIDGNPLESIGPLKQPVGVMVRGRWFPREALAEMLAVLAQ